MPCVNLFHCNSLLGIIRAYSANTLAVESKLMSNTLTLGPPIEKTHLISIISRSSYSTQIMHKKLRSHASVFGMYHNMCVYVLHNKLVCTWPLKRVFLYYFKWPVSVSVENDSNSIFWIEFSYQFSIHSIDFELSSSIRLFFYVNRLIKAAVACWLKSRITF